MVDDWLTVTSATFACLQCLLCSRKLKRTVNLNLHKQIAQIIQYISTLQTGNIRNCSQLLKEVYTKELLGYECHTLG